MDGRRIRKTIWTRFETSIFRLLKEKNLRGRKILVAVSGGLDSTALLYALVAIAKPLDLKLTVAHVHHGDLAKRARDKALKFVESMAKKLSVEFRSIKVTGNPKSEAELRKVRYEALEKMRLETGSDFVALAHHSDDLLETRLIRLIRGAGPEGLKSMGILSGVKLRPFLSVPRKDLRTYLGEKSAAWLEDPSNAKAEPLRNWIRLTWLPALEEKRAGGVKTLARSLESLAAKRNHEWAKSYFDERGIQRGRLSELNQLEQRQVVASFLRHRGAQNYTYSHIEEVLKRLRNPQSVLAFRCLDRDWKVNAEYIEFL